MPNKMPVCALPVRSTAIHTRPYDNKGKKDSIKPLPLSCQITHTTASNSLFFFALAIIYLKNRVNRSWYTTEPPTTTVIPDEEKARVRDRLVPLLANSDVLVRQQLIPVIQRVLQTDFPSRWPNFMNYTTELLNTNNPGSVLAGLQCLLAICRAFRFKASDSADRQHFDNIVETSFPRLLAICNELVNQESDEAGEMLHLALKTYKHATWVCTTCQD